MPSSTYAIVGRPVEMTASAAPAGLVGQITVEAYDPSTGAAVLAATTAGISEPRSGTYAAALTFPSAGELMVRWVAPGGHVAEEQITVYTAASAPTPPVTPVGEPYYCTAAQLRAEAGVDSTTLDDTHALALILDAEDAIDDLLGAWQINITTGRKIFAANVLAWQFDKLGRATAKLAAAIYAQPKLLTDQQWRNVRGPDFSFSGPITGRIAALSPVLMLLNQSGLRRLTTQAKPRISQTGVGVIAGLPLANGPADPETLDDGLSGIDLNASDAGDTGW